MLLHGGVVLGLPALAALALVGCSAGGSSESAFGGSGSHLPPDASAPDGALFDGSAGGDDAGGPADGASCGSVLLGASAQPGNVVVVFDQSNSMRQAFASGDAGATAPKWQVARDALAAAVQPIAASLRLGAIFFPTQPQPAGGTCGLVDLIDVAPPQIALTPGAAFLSSWGAHFAAPGWATILSTPLADALHKADLALADPFAFPGKRVVVVLTDGAPTCITAAAAVAAPVLAMASRGITTYVVGLPGSAGATALLDKLAAAGGTQHFLTPADAQALTAALAAIASGAVDPCTLTLDPPAPDPAKVWLYTTDANGTQTEVPQSDGWSVSADGATATLTGALCDGATHGAFTAMQFVFGCPLGGPH